MKFLMITGRTVNQGAYVERKLSAQYADETSTCFMHQFDMMDLGITDRERVQVTGPCGTVVLVIAASEDVNPGTVFVPYGPYANHIIGGHTHSTGMPDFKSIEVEIEATTEQRKGVYELMEELGGVAYDR